MRSLIIDAPTMLIFVPYSLKIGKARDSSLKAKSIQSKLAETQG